MDVPLSLRERDGVRENARFASTPLEQITGFDAVTPNPVYFTSNVKSSVAIFPGRIRMVRVCSPDLRWAAEIT
jgi:hypothetical protein